MGNKFIDYNVKLFYLYAILNIIFSIPKVKKIHSVNM